MKNETPKDLNNSPQLKKDLLFIQMVEVPETLKPNILLNTDYCTFFVPVLNVRALD